MAEDPSAADSLLPSESRPVVTSANDRKSSKEKEALDQTKEAQLEDHLHYVRHPTSFAETLTHVLKGNIGSGMFAMGEAFKNGGLLLSGPLTLVLAIICVYNNHVLLRAANFVKQKFALKHNPDFAETVELTFKAGPENFKRFANHARVIVKVFANVTQLGFCCIYISIVSETLQKIINLQLDYDLPQTAYMAVIFTPILVTSLITSLKFLAPVSLGSNICMYTAVFLTLFVAIRDNQAAILDRPAIGPIESFPLFISKIIFAFEGICLILPLRNEMKKPEQFEGNFGVLNIGMTIVCLLLIILGFSGYLSYGEDVKSSLTLNIPQNTWIGMTVQVVLCLGMLFSYPLQFYVAADIIWADIEEMFGPFEHWTFGKLVTRTCLVIITFCVAAAIPDVGLFISLIGSACATSLALLIPALLECSMHAEIPDKPIAKWLAIITLALAAFSFITGTYYSLKNMFILYFKPENIIFNNTSLWNGNLSNPLDSNSTTFNSTFTNFTL